MGKIINPTTNRPFIEAEPTSQVYALRHQILRALKNKYDSAQTTHQNSLHWINADHLSPNSANSLSIRKKVRSRSRYEVMNNGYLKGILLTIANDTVGSGPTIQITDARFTEEERTRIEKKWLRDGKKIKLRRKLWRMKFAKMMDGESFGFFFTNRKLRGVQSDVRVFECDQISHLTMTFKENGANEIDGIRFNRQSGEPESYHLLNEHPGETEIMNLRPLDGAWHPADQVIHWFRQDRSWLRGIPETSSTLPLWALLRRYTLAVVQNAEIAADFTVLLKSLQPPATNPFSLSGSPGQPTQEDPQDWFDSFPIDRGLMTVLPSMYDMSQLKPEQPMTVYDDFVKALVQEAARPLLCPRNLAIGNSGDYNMASGTLDRQMYRGAIDLERLDCDEQVLDVIFDEWWFEALRIPRYFEEDDFDGRGTTIASKVTKYPSLREECPEHSYHWDEVPEHTDPVKVATYIDLLHKGGHLSDVDIQEGRFNRRVEDHYANLEKQNKWRNENGFAMGTSAMEAEAAIAAKYAPEPDDGDEDGNGNSTSSKKNGKNGKSKSPKDRFSLSEN